MKSLSQFSRNAREPGMYPLTIVFIQPETAKDGGSTMQPL